MTLDLAMVLNMTPKAQETNKKRWFFYFIEINNFYVSETIKRGKRQPTELGKKFQSIYLIKI